MKYLALALLSLATLRAESLTYAISWPSGLSLGEATLTSNQKAEAKASPAKPGDTKGGDSKATDAKAPDAKAADAKADPTADSKPDSKSEPKHAAADPKAAGTADPKPGGPWSFHLDLEASVPGFAIRDSYQSTASAGLCSTELKKSISHGGHKLDETVTFDAQKNTATRQTGSAGGSTQVDVSPCAHDALAFLQFARNELAHGRMIPQQAVIFGGPYDVRMVLTGAETVAVDGKRTEADHVQATIKGPSREYTVELYFARDPVRTPVLARIPLPLGAFTAELMR